MSIRLDTEELAFPNLEGGHVLSLYLQNDPLRGPLKQQFNLLFANKLGNITHGFEEGEELREFNVCLERALVFLSKCVPRGRTLILFCGAAGSLWFRQVDVAIANDLRWQETAHVLPLLEALEENERYGVVLVGPSESRIFSIGTNRIHEHVKIDRPAPDDDPGVWQLVYSRSFAQRGSECAVCGALYGDESALCPECDVALKPVDDLGDAIVARALNMDASVEEVTGSAATRLDKAGGIGAFLR